MKTIGILVAGHIPVELADTYGNYAKLFASLLDGFEFTFRPYFVVDNEFPDSPDEVDGWLITGSRFGAYEEHDWIGRLEDFIRAVHQARVPMVGICFGHQLIAKALGGKVEKFHGGWSAGTTTYRRHDRDETQVLLAWHQDQVTEPPKGAEVIASNDFCAYAALSYGDWGLTFQPHPEFTPTFYEGLAEARSAVLEADHYQRVRKVNADLSTRAVAAEIGAFLARPRG